MVYGVEINFNSLTIVLCGKKISYNIIMSLVNKFRSKSSVIDSKSSCYPCSANTPENTECVSVSIEQSSQLSIRTRVYVELLNLSAPSVFQKLHSLTFTLILISKNTKTEQKG